MTGWSVWLASGSFFGTLSQAFLLGQLALWSVLGGETGEVLSSWLVKSALELVDCRWNLQTSLKKDVFGPSDEVSQVTFWLDVLTNAKVLGTLFEKRVLSSCFSSLRHCRAVCFDKRDVKRPH